VEVGGAQPGLGYTGEWWDESLEMVYLRARWYDAQVGRFASRDSWEGDMLEPQTLSPGYIYARNNPVNRVDPSGAIDFLVWYKAVHMVSPSWHGACSIPFDYQPYAHLNVFLGSEIHRPERNSKGQNSEEAWNDAPAEIIRGLHLAIRGYQNLVGPAFGIRMGQAGDGGMVAVLYGEPWVTTTRMGYLYPPKTNEDIGQILVREDYLDPNHITPIGNIVGNGAQKAAGGFAHEFTHILAQKILPANGIYVEHNYCTRVGGYIERGAWRTYTESDVSGALYCPQGSGADALPEALANTVGLYIATGGIEPLPDPGLSNAFDWVEEYYRDKVVGQ
jgi:RHS repeat-associated protein